MFYIVRYFPGEKEPFDVLVSESLEIKREGIMENHAFLTLEEAAQVFGGGN